MCAVVDNRLHFKPVLFEAKGATTYRRIIGAKGQFRGFSQDNNGAVVVAPPQMGKVKEKLAAANDGAAGFEALVRKALELAHGGWLDPFGSLTQIDGVDLHPGSYFWVTAGSPSPAPLAVLIPKDPIIPLAYGGLLARQQFWALKKTAEQ